MVSYGFLPIPSKNKLATLTYVWEIVSDLFDFIQIVDNENRVCLLLKIGEILKVLNKRILKPKLWTLKFICLKTQKYRSIAESD